MGKYPFAHHTTTDPAKSCGKDNLSITRLLNHVEDEIKETLAIQIDVAVEKANFSRDWRNRRIAHNDLDLAMNRQVEPLAPASREKVKEAMVSITKVLNVISQHYMGSTTIFDLSKGVHGAVSLLYVLDDGVKAANERSERIQSGKYLPDDFKRRDL